MNSKLTGIAQRARLRNLERGITELMGLVKEKPTNPFNTLTASQKTEVRKLLNELKISMRYGK